MDALHAKKTPRGMVITLGDVLFDTNKAQLKSGGLRNVQKLADFLKQYPTRKVQIEGFTDSTGSTARNQVLSEQRAVTSDRISTKGYGESYAIASNNNAAGRQLNRRVEIVLSDADGNIKPR
jgi:outer membrane protein OmpA-like peptidoglycan-associated protein